MTLNVQTNIIDANAIFGAAFRVRFPALTIGSETDAHGDFAIDLLMACSPFNGALPAALIAQQARQQDASHRAAHPEATRYVVSRSEKPIGRFVVDWSIDPIPAIDIAVLPGERVSGAGLGLLRALAEVGDRANRSVRLSVLRDNPARRIYERLGFVVSIDDDGTSPVVAMCRSPGAVGRA